MQDQPDTQAEGPSKSQRKRDMTALQELGAALTGISAGALEKCMLPTALLDEIAEYKRLPNKHGARKRQLQYIGKRMRDLDEEALSRITAQIRQDEPAEKRRFMALETVRSRLLEGDSTAVDELLQSAPGLDVQQLQQLVRQARKEMEAGTTPLASRKLFQYLRTLLGV